MCRFIEKIIRNKIDIKVNKRSFCLISQTSTTFKFKVSFIDYY